MTDPRFDTAYHSPVMVEEVCRSLMPDTLKSGEAAGAPEPAADERHAPPPRMLDGTLGGGGHSAALLERGAHVTGLDRDPGAIAEATRRLAAFRSGGAFRAFESNFASFDCIAELSGVAFDGILLDLGVSSHQFNDDTRGFSFREGAPLDMRMEGGGPMSGRANAGAPGGPSAADFLNDSDEEDLTGAFREYADEPKAGRLAREIVRRRENRPFVTSDDLVGAIRAVLGPRSGPPDFARIFQAVRIAVNDELGALQRALPALRDRLAPLGVIAVITYHSGEDRTVKHTFREWSVPCICPPRQPICTCGGAHALGEVITRKAVTATPGEVARNGRARSAKLRAWRRLIPA